MVSRRVNFKVPWRPINGCVYVYENVTDGREHAVSVEVPKHFRNSRRLYVLSFLFFLLRVLKNLLTHYDYGLCVCLIYFYILISCVF